MNTQKVSSNDFVISPRRAPVWDGLNEQDRTLLERAAQETLTGGGDREDTLEELLRHKAAIAAVPEGHLWVEQPREAFGPPTGAVNWETGEEATADEALAMNSIGSVPNTHNLVSYLQDPRFETDRFMDAYYTSPVFLKHAGRTVTQATFGEDDGNYPQVEDAVNQLTTPEAFIKGARAKSGLFTTPVPFDSNAFISDVPMSAVDRPGGLLVQPYVHMRYEYRIFVVNHELVTGAGCVEHHTPLDCRDLFDPAMEEHRGDGIVVDAPQVLNQHLRFADEFVKDWQDEHHEHGMYVLDVALNEKDETVAIELNALPNAGLYASDVYALFRAWVVSLL